MTYKELLEELCRCSENQLLQDVTVHFPHIDEYYPATLATTGDDCQVLDPGHLVLAVQDNEDVGLSEEQQHALDLLNKNEFEE